MRYRLAISEKAREQLRSLPKEIRRNIGKRMEVMRDDLRRDVTKLKETEVAVIVCALAPIVFSSFSPAM
jgi:mRNA-degrading endonuclease RelE of RelBE toxin-antitoxin system